MATGIRGRRPGVPVGGKGIGNQDGITAEDTQKYMDAVDTANPGAQGADDVDFEAGIAALPEFNDDPTAAMTVRDVTGGLVGDGSVMIDIKEQPTQVKITVPNLLYDAFVAKLVPVQREKERRLRIEAFETRSGKQIDLFDESTQRAARLYSKEVWDKIVATIEHKTREWRNAGRSFSLRDIYIFMSETFPGLDAEKLRREMILQFAAMIEWQNRMYRKVGEWPEQLENIKTWLKMNGVVFKQK